MPAALTGLSNFAGAPSTTKPNAQPNTPFDPGGSATAGVGTGSLGEFGGYIPTPLNQFNNYQDYLNYMPGAKQMDYFAGDPLNYGGIGMSDRWGYTQDILQSPYQAQALQGTYDAARAALGYIYNDQGNVIGNTGQGFVQKDWLPTAQNMYQQATDEQKKAQQLWDTGQEAWKYGQEAWKTGQEAWKTGQDVWQTAADPQQALYNRTLQQLTDQQRAGLEARGIDMTPYGAGIEGSTLSNFNIDWQNNLLNRMMQGDQAVMQGAQAVMGGDQAVMQGAQAVMEGGAGYGGLQALAQSEQQSAADLQNMSGHAIQEYSGVPNEMWNRIMQNQIGAVDAYQDYGLKAMIPGQMTFKNWQDVQNQFLTSNQQSFNQNQISGFEDPFAMMQLQSQIEMQREQMNMQEEMQKSQQKQQMAMQGAQMGMGLLSGMGGKGCWIAEAIYGVDDERTHLVRTWLNGPFRRTLLGAAVMAVYIAIGQRVAAVVRASPRVKSMFKPLFDCALRQARSEIVMNPNRRV